MRLSVLLLTFAAVCAQAQTLTHGADRLGLDIRSVALNAPATSVQLVLHNEGDGPVEAYVIHVNAGYANGEQAVAETVVDYFDTLGLERFDTADHPSGALQQGANRSMVAQLPHSKARNTTLATVDVTVTTVLFKDDVLFTEQGVPGQQERVQEIFAKRDAQSAEVSRWCSSLDRIPGARFTKKSFNDFLDANMSASGKQPQSPGGVADTTRKSLATAFQQGIEWGADGTGLLKLAASETINAQCMTSRTYIGQRELAKTQR
jgi:hypothetical protein